MKAERITLIGVGVLLVVGLVATVAPSVLPGGVGWHGAFELLLWATTALFAATALVWVVHSMDTVAGVLDPPGDFRVTEKAGGE